MDELAQARVELTLLEEKARKLLKQLLDVRTTIATQRAKIDGLSRKCLRLSTIHRLPTEILVFILDLDVYPLYLPERKQELASICRRWRDIILRTPCFWSTIHVASDVSSINTHLERSRGALLDIVIKCAPFRVSPPKYLALIPGLDIVMACAHRWRSLLVTENLFREGHDGQLLTEFIADKINRFHFPSLKSVTIPPFCDVGYLDFLSIARAPVLEHLEFGAFTIQCDILRSVALLKTLKLNCGAGPLADHPSIWSLIPTQALTRLSLIGEPKSFSVQPNSLHFPSLMSLELVEVTKARPFLDAIVAPNLEQLKYNSSCYDDLPSVTFSGFSSKFANVRQLSFFRYGMWHTPDLPDGDATCLCEAFPGVHHVELDGGDWPYLFEPDPNSHIQYPMDLWTELESLAFHSRLHFEWLEPDKLTAWLVHRRALNLQRLHVKVKGPYQSNVVQGIDQRHIRVYERLKENCILELDGFPFPMMDFSSWPGGVSSFRITSSGNSAHSNLAVPGANKDSGRDCRNILSWRRLS